MPKYIIDYVIDITICNMNNYNRLGKLDDLNNSVFLGQEVDEDSYIESSDERIYFSDISEFSDIENVSFSIKEMIDLCMKDDFSIRIFTKDNSEIHLL